MRAEAIRRTVASFPGALSDAVIRDLTEFWALRNGFYAFESAFHLFAIGSSNEISLAAWNAEGCWRSDYDGLADGWLFFAEDVFGGPFCAREGAFGSFDPETGEVEIIADGLEAFCAALLADYETLTGQPLAHRWQKRHGKLRPGHRLEAIRPFVLGGKFTVGNLREARTENLLRGRARLARAIRAFPDGAEIDWPLPE